MISELVVHLIPTTLFTISAENAVKVTGKIVVSVSPSSSAAPFGVTLTSVGSGILYISQSNALQNAPTFELNPTRNNIWLSTPEGLLGDVTQGPYADIRVNQTIFDQYGRVVPPSNLLVYRQDLRSRIQVLQQIPNDVDQWYINDPYNYIHLGGGHFFVQGYEHYLIFNPYTAGNVLIYDSFLGLNTSKFDLDFNKQATQTLRPTLGGYYLLDGKFNRNIEGSAIDLETCYDTYGSIENSNNVKLAQSLLGYTGDKGYMAQINIGSKAQFLYYRGMIHAKGSMNSVQAYINSRRFIDAQLDEVWAFKLAEFGDNRARYYPEVILFPDDGLVNDIRLYFLGLADNPTDPILLEATKQKGFDLVSFSDDTRWNNFPEQQTIINQPLFLDADLNSTTVVFVSITPPPQTYISLVSYWYNTNDGTLHSWNGVDWSTLVENKVLVVNPPVVTPTPIPALQPHVFWRHDEPCDGVRVVQRIVNIKEIAVPLVSGFANSTQLPISNGFTVTGDLTNVIYSGTSLTITGSVNDGTYNVEESYFNLKQNLTYIIVTTIVPYDSAGGVLTYAYADLNFYDTYHFDPGPTGLIQYVRVNSEVVRMDQTAWNGLMYISTVRPAYDKINPAKLVDKTTDETINQITLWHPAYGWHYYRANYNIDFMEAKDPAQYSQSLDPSDISSNFWNFNEIGKVWFDTSQLGYVPYYDDIINPDINSRLYSWGNLAPYASIGVYQWIRSTVSPAQWDILAAQQTGDITIDPSIRITGTARTTLFRRDRTVSAATITATSPTLITSQGVGIQENQPIFLTSTSGVLSGVNLNYQYYALGAELWHGQQPVCRLESIHCFGLTASKIKIYTEQVLQAFSKKYQVNLYQYKEMFEISPLQCPVRPCPLHPES